MNPITSIITKLEGFKSNYELIAITVIKNSNSVVKLQQQQLLRGETNEGKYISPKYRNPRYAARKQATNSLPPAGTPDLKNTGKYHRAFKDKYSGGNITIENTDSKDVSLSKKYDNIKGLNETSLSELRDVAKDGLITELRTLLQ